MPAKISIITPVYNVDSFLQKSVNSIREQDFTDWELILIDDGSTDNSAGICDDFAKIDHRIRVIHKLNEGVSIARQVGLDAAEGEYVIHVDPDDWIERDMLGKLYFAAKANDADVVICDFFVNCANGTQIYRQQQPSSLNADGVLYDLFQQLHGSCWNKLIRHEFITAYKICFTAHIDYCEDFLFWVQVYSHPEVKTAYLPEAFYHYYENPNSITRAYSYETYLIRLKFYDRLEQIVPKIKFSKELRKIRLGILFEAFMHRAISNFEAWKILCGNLRGAWECKCLRWKVGYLALFLGIFPVAHKLLKF